MINSLDITTSPAAILALRGADLDDAAVLRRLADLDDAPPLEGPVLLALIDGVAVAAMSLRDGRVVADPFRRTADTVRLLALRARQLAGENHSPWAPGQVHPSLRRRKLPRLRSGLTASGPAAR